MTGLMASGPSSAAAASAPADQLSHCASSSARSSKTHESTSVTGRGAWPVTSRRRSFATEQVHQLVGGQAPDFAGCRTASQPPDKTLPARLGSLRADDLQETAVLHHIDLITLVQAVLFPQRRRYRHLPFAVELHAGLLCNVLHLLRNSSGCHRLHSPARWTPAMPAPLESEMA